MYNIIMIKNKTKFIRVNYHLTIEQKDKLKQLANFTGITTASHIRQAVNEYLKKFNL